MSFESGAYGSKELSHLCDANLLVSVIGLEGEAIFDAVFSMNPSEIGESEGHAAVAEWARENFSKFALHAAGDAHLVVVARFDSFDKLFAAIVGATAAGWEWISEKSSEVVGNGEALPLLVFRRSADTSLKPPAIGVVLDWAVSVEKKLANDMRNARALRQFLLVRTGAEERRDLTWEDGVRYAVYEGRAQQRVFRFFRSEMGNMTFSWESL